jgi:hypothetical protein
MRVLFGGGGHKAAYDRPRGRSSVSVKDLDEEGKKRYDALPEIAPLVDFGTAVRTRQQAGGHAESSHRVSTLMNLCNIAVRLNRTIHFDPDKEVIVGDEEAARFVDIPMRAPWHL